MVVLCINFFKKLQTALWSCLKWEICLYCAFDECMRGITTYVRNRSPKKFFCIIIVLFSCYCWWCCYFVFLSCCTSGPRLSEARELNEHAKKMFMCEHFEKYDQKCYILIFDRVHKFVDFKNRIHLCRKANKRQRKCHVNCVGGIPKGIATTWHVGV